LHPNISKRDKYSSETLFHKKRERQREREREIFQTIVKEKAFNFLSSSLFSPS